MSKILISGMTARMTGSDRIAINYLTVSQLIKMMLEELGHDVHHKHVEVGEDVSGYDLYLIGCAPLHSIGSGRAINMAPIVHAHSSRVVLYAEDWSFGGYGKTCQGALAGWDKFLKWRNWPCEQKYKAMLKEFVSNTVPTAVCPWPVMFPAYSWGKHEIIFDNNFQLLPRNIWAFDPSSFVPKIKFTEAPKKRQWVLSQLSDQTNWIKKLALGWPLVSVGNRRLNQPVLEEPDLIQLYAESWGMLASKYSKIAGSGWWRVRYLHSHWVKSVMLTDPLDAAEIGHSYEVTAKIVESMKEKELESLAHLQKLEFERHLWTKSMVLAKLNQQLIDYIK